MGSDAYTLYVIDFGDAGDEAGKSTQLASYPSRNHAMYQLQRHRFRIQNESGGKFTFAGVSEEGFDLIDAEGKRRTRYEIRRS